MINNIAWFLLLAPNVALFILNVLYRNANPNVAEIELLAATRYWYVSVVVWNVIFGVLTIWLEFREK